MPRVLLNFQHYDDLWTVHFTEADCKTLIGTKTRYYNFATEEGLRSFVIRCNSETCRSLNAAFEPGAEAATSSICQMSSMPN